MAWLVGTLVLASFVVWQLVRGADAAVPLPVLYTLGGEFVLDATRGGRVALSDFRGSLVLLNFGYTGCPDVCPTALSRMRDALNLADTPDQLVVPLFVTLDPAADTTARLKPYVAFFHRDLIGLTGSDDEIAAAAAAFKVFNERVSDGTAGAYQVSHSSHLYLIDSAGRVRGTFGEGVPVEEIATAIRRLQKESGNPEEVST
ncbi:MAG: SCO family protein [Pseudomonadales bacterium]